MKVGTEALLLTLFSPASLVLRTNCAIFVGWVDIFAESKGGRLAEEADEGGKCADRDFILPAKGCKKSLRTRNQGVYTRECVRSEREL